MRLAQASRQLIAIHVGHMGIEEDAVELLALIDEERERRSRAVDTAGHDRPVREHAGENTPVGGVVVDDQDVLAGEVHVRRYCFRRMVIDFERQRDSEGAALARRTLDTDAAAHQLDEAAGDRQTEAGTAKSARGGAVFLGKGFKDGFLLVGGDADAGIAHGDLQRHLALLGCGGPQKHGNFAVGRELDGVADKIDQHLPQAAGVANHVARHLRLDRKNQLQLLFMRAQRQGLQRFGDDAVEIEGNAFDHQLAGFDLREIKNVVDDRQQRLGQRFDDAHELPLFLGQCGIERKIGHTDDAVHRRADLVAHVGKEVALRPAGRLGSFLGLLHRGFGGFALGDVDDRSEQPVNLPVTIA